MSHLRGIAMSESKISGLQFKVQSHEHQLALCLEMLRSLSSDVKVLRSEADRARERDAIYDRWIRLMPVIIGIISGIFWLFHHAVQGGQ